MLIPPGVAHVYLALADLDLIYVVTRTYDPHLEHGMAWDDAQLPVDWQVDDALVSERASEIGTTAAGMAAARIHVTGAGGQVGTALREVLPGARCVTHDLLDVTDAAALTGALHGADCVVHLAAMTHVDRCEEQPDVAQEVNDTGTRTVCSAAPRARLIYLSTDYVFAGSLSSHVPGPGRTRNRMYPSRSTDAGTPASKLKASIMVALTKGVTFRA